MLKDRKGYLITETIIAITIIATIITTIYVIIMNNLTKQSNDITKNNTAYGMYVLKEARKYYLDNEEGYIEYLRDSNNDYVEITDNAPAFFESINVYKLYFLGYDKLPVLISNEKIPYAIKKELKSEFKDTTSNNEKCLYRYLLIFKEVIDDNKLADYSYATMGASCSK